MVLVSSPSLAAVMIAAGSPVAHNLLWACKHLDTEMSLYILQDPYG
jgi:hypothetical protein